MKVSKIVIDVSFLEYKNFSYLVFDDDSRDGVLIDPAWQKLKIDSIIQQYRVNVRAVLITHNHVDHIHLAERMSIKCQVPIVISSLDVHNAGFGDELNVQLIDGDDPLHFGSLNVTPLLTPGHTPGSTCYRIGDGLFSGDTLFIEGCGMCFDKDSDPEALYQSMQKIKSAIPANTEVYPGHKYYYEIGQQFHFLMKHNIYLQFDNVKHFVAFRMREGQKGLFKFQ